MNTKPDWRADFRLHTMDLARPPRPPERARSHWILEDKTFGEMVLTVEAYWLCVLEMGGDPLPGAEISPWTVVAKLGYADRQEARGFFANAKFNASFLFACTRELLKMQNEMVRLHRGSASAAGSQ